MTEHIRILVKLGKEVQEHRPEKIICYLKGYT